MVYGLRTSLFSLGAALITSVSASAAGIASDCSRLGGRGYRWITDFALALPFLIFALAVVPRWSFGSTVRRPSFDDIPDHCADRDLRHFWLDGMCRLVRGQILSLREREFIEAARPADE